jgi:hypothetical protein
MGDFFWFEQNWFSLIQTIGILSGFLLAARSLALDRGIRKTEILMQLTESHREIWEGFLDDANLEATLNPYRKIETHPISFAEKRFVTSVLLHMAMVHRASLHGVFEPWQGLKLDIYEFLQLPVPQEVFRTIRPYQEQAFLDFIDSLWQESPF